MRLRTPAVPSVPCGFLRTGLLLLPLLVAAGCGGSPSSSAPAETPRLVLSPTSVSFTGQSGGAAPQAQGVTVTNGSTGSIAQLTVSITYASGQTPGWLTATLGGTQAPTTVSLSASQGSLPVGNYTATVSVFGTGPTNSPQTVAVNLTVTAPPATIVLGTQQVSFAAVQGAASPAAQQVAVTSGGSTAAGGLAAAVSYGTGQPTGWLAAALSGSSTPSTLSLTPSTSNLAAGSYSASVAVASSSASNSPQTVAVTLEVTDDRPSIATNSAALNVTAPYASAAALVRTVEVTNGGGGSLGGLSVAVAFTDTNRPAWLTASLDATTAPATLTVTVPPLELLGDGTLIPGTYTATVILVSAQAANSPQAIPVNLTVTAPPPVIQLYTEEPQPPSSLPGVQVTFGAIVGAADPDPKSVFITDRYEGLTGGIPLAGLGIDVVYVSGSSGWLSVFLDGFEAPATVTLEPRTSGLAEGIYLAQVRVTSPVASNSPQTILVSMTVAAAVPPTVVQSFPAANSTGAGVETEVQVTFSADMDPATINTSTFTLTGQVGPPPLAGALPPPALVPGIVTYDEVSRTATFTPTGAHLLSEFEAEYEVRLTTGIQDMIGTPVAEDIVFTFTTVDFDQGYTYRMWNVQDGPNYILATSQTDPFFCGMQATRPEEPHLDNSVWYVGNSGVAPRTYQLQNFQFDNLRSLTIPEYSPSVNMSCRMENRIGGGAGFPSTQLQLQLWTFVPQGNQIYRIHSFRLGSGFSLGTISPRGPVWIVPTFDDARQLWVIARRGRRS